MVLSKVDLAPVIRPETPIDVGQFTQPNITTPDS